MGMLNEVLGNSTSKIQLSANGEDIGVAVTNRSSIEVRIDVIELQFSEIVEIPVQTAGHVREFATVDRLVIEINPRTACCNFPGAGAAASSTRRLLWPNSAKDSVGFIVGAMSAAFPVAASRVRRNPRSS